MDFTGALMLLSGALGCGALLGLFLSLLLWRGAPSYAAALRTGLKIGLSIFGFAFVCLVYQGLYENWVRGATTQTTAEAGQQEQA